MKILTYIIITLTAYSPEPRQTDSTPFITAFNRRVHHCGIAVSRDLERAGFKKGCFVEIPDVQHCGGYFVVNDRMHYRKRKHADLFFFKTSNAWKFGIKKAKIKLLWCMK